MTEYIFWGAVTLFISQNIFDDMETLTLIDCNTFLLVTSGVLIVSCYDVSWYKM